MKNKFSNLIIFYIIIFIAFPSAVSAQEMPISHSISDLKGFNRNVFDIHFNRADRELSPERWLSEAKWGISQALSAWELYASALFDSSFKLEEAKTQIENWCNEELEIRFSNWLTERFFGELAEKSIADLHAMLAVNDEDISLESFDWRSEKNDYIITSGNTVTDNLHYLYVELLDYIPSEMRESMNKIIMDSAVKTINLLKSEFENIAARQERIFTRRRMPDYLSAEYQTYLAKKTARHLSDQLVIETEEFCSLGINEIRVKIEQASAGTGDLVLLGDEWLQLYKEQFERGLKAWQDAEERFFMRRIEWEQETFNVYSEGEDVWYEAFATFEKKRTEWELLIKELLEEGEKHFKNISENFERNIAEAKAEFEINAAIRTGTVSAKIKALSDIYLAFMSTANSIRENILFTEKTILGTSIKDPNDNDFLAWLSEQRKNLWQSALTSYTSLDPSFMTELIILRLKEIDLKAGEKTEAYIQEYNEKLEYLQNKYQPYYQIQKIINGEFSFDEEILYSKEIENLGILNIQSFNQCIKLIDTYEFYVSYIAKAVETRDTIISDFSGIFGENFVLKNILLQNMSSEDFCLDEYQIALIRANTLVQYWERKTHIAEVVTQLSFDYENGLVKEDDIYNAWLEAKTAYEKSIILYNNELEKLSNISGNIYTQQQILDNLSQKMKIEEEKLAKLNSQYSALLMVNAVGQIDFLNKDLKNKYILLVSEYERLFKTGDNASYKNLLDYGMKYSLAEQLEDAKNILDILVNGNDADVMSLSELKKNTQNDIDIKLRLAAIDMFADSGNQLRGQDSSYSSADWYLKAKGISAVDFNINLLYGENLGLQLASDLYNITKKLYEERLDLELAKFTEYLEEISGTDEYGVVLQIYTTLLNLQKLIKNDELDKIDYENETISYFFSNGSFLISGTEENIPELYNEYRYCSGLLEIFNNYAAINSFSSKEIWRQSTAKLQKLLNDYGISFGNNYLPDAELICNAITGKQGNLLHNTSVFLIEFNNCFSLLPALLSNEIFYWEQSMLKYIAAYAFVNNIDTTIISSIQEEQNIEKNIIFIIESLKNEYSSNEKYWRQFLSSNYINEYDYVITWKPNLSTGLLTDTQEIVNYYTNRLRDSFTLYSRGNIDLSSGNLNMFYYLYSNEINKTDQDINKFNYYKNEILRIGAAYDYMCLSDNDADIELKKISDAIKKQEDVFSDLHDKYMSAAIVFEKYGRAYNEQYNLVKSVYNESNVNRYEYELQDSIIRYTSTIYMDFELFNLQQCKEKLNRAKTALKVLTDLYADQDMRPYQSNEYNELYSAYEKNFSVKMLTMKAFNTISDEIINANDNYNSAYNYYIYNINNLGNVDQEYKGYISPDDRAAWAIKDIITVNNGRLAFSLSGNTSTGIDGSKADAPDT